MKKFSSAIFVVSGGAASCCGWCIYKGNEKFYSDWLMPIIHMFDAERSHRMAVLLAKYKVVPKQSKPDPEILHSKLWGREFSNPVGLAAGFDKHGEAVDGLLKMGFGFVEVGTITPQPQEGNPKPRIFRLVKDKAVINRYGFNSDGHETVYKRLRTREGSDLFVPLSRIGYMEDDRIMLNFNFWTEHARFGFKPNVKAKGVLGVNLGANKHSGYPIDDYVKGVKRFGNVADYLVINISCPNIPAAGGRNLQNRKQLEELIQKVVKERDSLPSSNKPQVLVKISPDLSDGDKENIAAVVCNIKSGVDGLIITNTTTCRPASLQGQHKTEQGGLSGKPLRDMSSKSISDMYKLTKGTMPIIGVGGVSSGQDAYDKIRAGASLIQLYTSLVYQGPPVIQKIKRDLESLLRKDGFSSISEAVGADNKPTE